jgi:hypothetical protein
MSDPKAILEFWRSFQKNSVALSQIETADDPVYDELLETLHQIDTGLYFEFSAQSEQCELLITAEGNRALFACVDEIVSVAPNVDGWKIFALKPKLGFPETMKWDGFKIVIADVVFDPLDNEDGELGLRLLVPGLMAENFDNAHNGLLRAIDRGLGEREFAESIQFTEVAALVGSASEYIPLTDLESFIQWRMQQRK